MPTWLKVVLGILIAGVVLCGGGVAAVTFWVKANEGKLKETGTRAKADAEAFAKTSDQSGCVREALGRLKVKSGLLDEVEHRVFLTECLKVAPQTPGFCEGVPKMDQIMAAAGWARDQCASYEGPKESCGRTLQEVMKHCAE